MPAARTKTKQPIKNRRDKAKPRHTASGKRARRKDKPSFTAAYDAKKFAGSVPAFAEITAEELRSWRDDR